MTNTHDAATRTRPAREAGFTLLEVLLSVSIAAILITAVMQIFQATIMAREEVKALADPMSKGPHILDMIEEDFQALWTYSIAENRVFRGEDRDIVGQSADRIHMLVAGPSVFPVRLDDDSMRRAPYAEVSYVLRANDHNPNHMELWRREDPLFDKELQRGGNYLLLSDRVKSFEVNYYDELGEEAEPIEDWDAAERGNLPRRIKIEMELERSADSHNVLVEVDEVGGRTEKYVRHVVFSQDRVNILNGGIALMPLVPERAPEPEGAGAGGGAPPPGMGGANGGRIGLDGGGRGGQNNRAGGRGSSASRTKLGGDAGKSARNAFDRIIRSGGTGGGGLNLGGLGRGAGGGNNRR